MKTIHKITAALLSASLFALVLTGCSTDSNNASKSSKTKKIGVIQYAPHPSLDNCYTGLKQGLEEAGYKEGESLSIDFQNAQGQIETSDQIAKNMAAKNYDMIIGIATPAAMSAYSACIGTDITTVFCAVSDPVSAKLVKSIDNPSYNCTGSSDVLNLEAQLKMIRAIQPDAKKIGILYTTNEANSVSHLNKIKTLAPDYGFEIVEQGVQNASDIPQAAATLVTKVDCINNFTDNNVVNSLSTVLQKANEASIPVYGSEIEQVKNGCVASESIDYVALGKQTGALAASILNGAKASETAVVRVNDSTPVINTQVMEALKLSVPDTYKEAEKVTTAQ